MNAAIKYLPVVRYPHESDCTWAGPGKCRHFACRHSVLETWAKIEQWESDDIDELIDALPESCALALADYGGFTIDQVAVLLGLPRDKVERTEASALRKLSRQKELRRARWDSRG